jgi:hypothetical protein
MHAPTSVHFAAVKRVLRYLKGSLNSGLHYSKWPFNLIAYCDSDWTGNLDDRKSTTGYGVFLGPNLISWSTKKQHTVSRSTTEGEYRALSLIAAELFWLRMLLKELHIVLTSFPTNWSDNSSALALVSNPVFHARTKYIEVNFHFIREKVANRDIQLQYLPILEQVADIFTKGHTSDRFCYLRDKLRVVPPFSLRGGVKEENQDHAEDHAEGVNPDQAHSIANSSRPTRDTPIQDSISSYFSLHQRMFNNLSPQFTINRNHLSQQSTPDQASHLQLFL